MAGVRRGQHAGRRVEDRVDAGDDLDRVERRHQLVEVVQHRRRPEVEDGERPGGRAQLTHHGRRVDAASHHVADDDAGTPGGQRDQVEPVAADLGVAAAWQVDRLLLEPLGVAAAARAACCAAA